MEHELPWNHLEQLLLDSQGVGSDCQARPVRHAKHMGVHGHCWLTKKDIEHHIGRLAPYSRQRFERVTVLRHLAIVLLQQLLAEQPNVLGLGAVQPDGPDELLDLVLPECHHGGWRGSAFKQFPRCLVDPGVGRLGGQDHSHQERESVHIFEFTLGLGLYLPKTTEHFPDLCPSQAFHFFWLNHFPIQRSPVIVIAGESIMPMQATTTTPLFSAQLTPHRSLGPRGVAIVTALCLVFAALPGLSMVSLGLWPIAALMMLTVLATGVALFMSLRQGKRQEQLTVWADQIEWVATDVNGARTLRRFDPKNIRLVLDRDHDEKTTAIRLRAGKDELEVGTFLNPDDKASFAKALGSALRKARRA